MCKEQFDVVGNLSPFTYLLELQLTLEKPDHWVNIASLLIKCGKTVLLTCIGLYQIVWMQ